MNNNPNEEKQADVIENLEVVPNKEQVNEVVTDSSTPATAQQIVSSMETAAAQAQDVYAKKEAPVAPQQDRIQLIDDKPKLHAVQLGGVTMETEKKENVTTEVLNSVNNTQVVTPTQQAETISEKPMSKIKVFGLILLFGGLLAMVIFLPEISAYIENQKYLRNQPADEKITTGSLECSKEDNSETLDYDYMFTFNFSDSKLTRLKSITEIRGDVSLDEKELDKLNSDCELLKKLTVDLKGISISCKLANGLFTKSQTFNLSSIVVDDAITAYVEAGGAYPFYRDGDNIDEVERELISTGYNCKRTK